MKKGKFFYLTIKGDGLNVKELKETVDLPCKVYFKGEKTTFQPKNEEFIQKDDRWLYTAVAQDETPINKFLVEQLEVIKVKLPVLERYIKDYHTLMELVIYEEEENNAFTMLFSKKVIKLLNIINVKFSLTFHDW